MDQPMDDWLIDSMTDKKAAYWKCDPFGYIYVKNYRFSYKDSDADNLNKVVKLLYMRTCSLSKLYKLLQHSVLINESIN